MGNCVPEAQQKANGEGKGGPSEHRRGVSRFGSIPEVYVTIVFSERVRGFEPRLAVEAEEAHGWKTLGSWRDRCSRFGVGLFVFGCHGRVGRRSPCPSEQGQAVCCCRRRRLPVS